MFFGIGFDGFRHRIFGFRVSRVFRHKGLKVCGVRV